MRFGGARNAKMGIRTMRPAKIKLGGRVGRGVIRPMHVSGGSNRFLAETTGVFRFH